MRTNWVRITLPYLNLELDLENKRQGRRDLATNNNTQPPPPLATTILDRMGCAASGVVRCWRYRMASSAARPPEARAAASISQGRVRRIRALPRYSLRMETRLAILIVSLPVAALISGPKKLNR